MNCAHCGSSAVRYNGGEGTKRTCRMGLRKLREACRIMKEIESNDGETFEVFESVDYSDMQDLSNEDIVERIQKETDEDLALKIKGQCMECRTLQKGREHICGNPDCGVEWDEVIQ